MLRQIEEFECSGSGWSLVEVLSLVVNIKQYQPIHAGSYIPLPSPIQRKQACINVKNKDNECFRWSVLSGLHPESTRNAHRCIVYIPYYNELNFSGLTFPMTLKQVKKFEKQNEVSVNIFILKKLGCKYHVGTAHLTDTCKSKHVNLLLIQDHYVDENNPSEGALDFVPKFHFVFIRDLSRLVRSQVTKRNCKIYICNRCLHYFLSEDNLKNHMVDCMKITKCKIILPTEENNKLKFKNYKNAERVSYVVYADFESLLKPTENKPAFQEHQAFSVGYYLKNTHDDSKSYYRSYRQTEEGEQTPADWFMNELKNIALELENVYKNPKRMIFTEHNYFEFHMAKVCWICGEALGSLRCRDHCHITGVYRGASHNKCNLNYVNSKHIPVIFHNLSGYDAHFLIKELASDKILKGRLRIIAENKDRYISFTKYIDNSIINFRFLDSFRFMASSLDQLSKYLPSKDITIRNLREVGYCDEQIDLLTQKGVYPYDFTNSFEKLKETSLPTKEDFYSKLVESHISQEEYDHAQKVWSKLNIKTLGEYADVYMRSDILILADVFENFRSTCMEAYSLDPAHYYTTPGLSFDAMLKRTKVELELITDVNILLFIQRGIRGEVSQICSKRFVEANNPYMANYDPQKEEKYLVYYDANNFYG